MTNEEINEWLKMNDDARISSQDNRFGLRKAICRQYPKAIRHLLDKAKK